MEPGTKRTREGGSRGRISAEQRRMGPHLRGRAQLCIRAHAAAPPRRGGDPERLRAALRHAALGPRARAVPRAAPDGDRQEPPLERKDIEASRLREPRGERGSDDLRARGALARERTPRAHYAVPRRPPGG